MNITEQVTLQFSPEDITEIVKEYINSNGYTFDKISFDVRSKLEGFGAGEHETIYFNGLTVKAKRK